MLTIEKIDSLNKLSIVKKAYFEKSTAPLDGMWHFGFVPMATHFGFYINEVLVGFCCMNDEGFLLQFYLAPNEKTTAQTLFTLISQQNSKVIGEVKGAYVSTAEPEYLSLCLDNSVNFKVESLMYQQSNDLPKKMADTIKPIVMTQVTDQQLDELVQFAISNIGAPKEWLTAYYGNLITREELFAYRRDGLLFAAGECRLFDEYQTQYAELGMIVAKSARGQGIATQVLNYLKAYAQGQGLQPVCSTERTNIAAQKAITSAGFITENRIVKFEFTPV